MYSPARTRRFQLQGGLAGYEQRQTTAKFGLGISVAASEERYAINALGFAVLGVLPKQTSVGLKYFKGVRESGDVPGIPAANCRLDWLLGLGTFVVGKEMNLIGSVLELDDIQSGVLRPRPAPYAAAYVLFRMNEVKAGRELMRRIRPVVASAAHPASPADDTWVSVALSFQGLKALGARQASPEHWEKPLGSADVHVVLTARSLRTRSDWKRRSREPARSTKRSLALLPCGARIVMLFRMKEKRLDSRTGSVIRRLKGRVFRALIPANSR